MMVFCYDAFCICRKGTIHKLVVSLIFLYQVESVMRIIEFNILMQQDDLKNIVCYFHIDVPFYNF